jgi:TPP-dependent pyruvate/acetoin dehydrogenase alpha subunit
MTAPHTLLALYHTMVMARAIERYLWVLDHTEQLPPHYVGRSNAGVGNTVLNARG